MFGFSRLTFYAVAGLAAAALLAGTVTWLRWDAVRDDRREREAEFNERRLGHIEEDQERDDEIEALDDAGLVERARRWLMPADDTAD